MTDHSIIKALICFLGDVETLSISPFGNGHINRTYLANTSSGQFILQRINTNVFDINSLESNYRLMANVPGAKAKAILQIPIFVKHQNNVHYRDEYGSYWRLSKYLTNSKIYSISPSTKVTFNAGKAISKFLMEINKIPQGLFRNTIPHFHDPQNRYINYLEAVNQTTLILRNNAIHEIRFVEEHKFIVEDIMRAIITDSIPTRITHNDPKLENILFFNKSRPVITDLDTVMPGYLMFDFGDMVRSITSLSREDESDLNKVRFNKEHFESLCNGFFNNFGDTISENERKHFFSGILSVIYIQAIRFLTDYLMGNIYYPISFDDHNLIRSRTQIKIIKDILYESNWVNSVINKYSS